jgi:WD40 repeat protein
MVRVGEASDTATTDAPRDHDKAHGSVAQPESISAIVTPPPGVDATETADHSRALRSSIDSHTRYVFGEVVAVGGLGVIRLAEDRRLGRAIAVKQIIRDSPAAQRRFTLEAAITARLQHPAIVPLYDLGWTDSGEPFYCMKLVEGETLDAKIQATTDIAGRSRLLEHVIAVADAIAYAHEQQIIHRDLKPANVIVGRFGETVVIDWGLAKDLSGKMAAQAGDADIATPAHLTADGAVLGTLRYMPPEQARGEDVDVRSDIYSLGAMLYHVLAGQPPFANAVGPHAAKRVIEGDLEQLRTIDPRIPRELAAVAHRALALRPADRYASAGEFAEDLRRFQTGRLVSAHSYSLQEMLRLWIRRHRTIVVSTALALIGLAVTIVVAFLRVQEERDTAREARDETRQAEAERGRQLYESLLVQAEARQQTIEFGQRYESLEAIQDAVQLAQARGDFDEHQRSRLRDLAIASLSRVDIRRTKQWRVDAFGTADFDGHLEHVSIPKRGDVFSVRRVADDVELFQIPSLNYDPWAMYARYFAGDSHLHVNYEDRNGSSYQHVFDIRGPTPIEQPHLRNVRELVETGDGQTVWRIGDDGHLLALDVESGRVQRRLATRLDRSQIDGLRVHPDGRYLAAIDRARIDFIDLDADVVLSSVLIEGGAKAVAWGEVDTCAVGEVGHISLWDPLTGLKHGELTGHDGWVVTLGFHPGHRILGSYSWDGTSRFWDVASRREVLRLEGWFLRFAIDGRRIAVQQGVGTDLELWDFAGDDFLRSLPGLAETVAFSEDGRYLAFAGDRGVELWDLAAFQRVRRLDNGQCTDAVFHPDGEGLLTLCARDGVSLWPLVRTTNGLEVGEPRPVMPPGPMHEHGSLVFPSKDPSFLAVTGGESGVYLFDANALMEIEKLRGDRFIHTLAISPDGRWVVASGWRSSSVLVWDRLSSAPPHVLQSSNNQNVTYFAFDPSGSHLFISTFAEISQWRVGTWEKQRFLPRNSVYHPLAMSVDGELLAVGEGGRSVQLLRTTDLALVATLRTPLRGLLDLRFSPDGRFLAAAATEQGVQVWDLESLRRELATMGLDWQP